MYRVGLETNDPKIALQAIGALGGLAIGWLLLRSPVGGLLGLVAGGLLATLAIEAAEDLARQLREEESYVAAPT